jgi:SRSO17 transposase
LFKAFHTRLAFTQGQRYFFELSFHDAKSYFGMGQYQVRSWQSWHCHMALVMMAMLFRLEVKLEQQRGISLFVILSQKSWPFTRNSMLCR